MVFRDCQQPHRDVTAPEAGREWNAQHCPSGLARRTEPVSANGGGPRPASISTRHRARAPGFTGKLDILLPLGRIEFSQLDAGARCGIAATAGRNVAAEFLSAGCL